MHSITVDGVCVCVWWFILSVSTYTSFAFAGHMEQCEMELCCCYSAPETLMQHHLWASSVQSPRLAFTLGFMHQVINHFLHCM